MQKAVLIVVSTILFFELCLVRDAFAADRLQQYARHYACVQKLYHMTPIGWYDQHDEYSRCDRV